VAVHQVEKMGGSKEFLKGTKWWGLWDGCRLRPIRCVATTFAIEFWTRRSREIGFCVRRLAWSIRDGT